MANFAALLDACVLVPAALRDTLLRFAESPSFYQPCWSGQIIAETRKALLKKIGLTEPQADRLIDQLREHFPEAWIAEYEPFIDSMTNHPGDRHVLAAATKAGAQTIVTFNVKHFPAKVLEPLGIEAQTPDEFLVHQFHLRPRLAAVRVSEQAAGIGRSAAETLDTLAQMVPEFAKLIATQLEKDS